MFLKNTKVSSRKWLLLPVETKSRELRAKILQAIIAVESGWGAVVGKKTNLKRIQPYLPTGVLIEKSIAPGRINDIEKAHSVGNRVSAWCEEGLMYINAEHYSGRRLEKESFNNIDYFFAWGERQRDDIAKSLNCNISKVILTGNPRFDLLKPELKGIFAKRGRQYKEQYGEYILLNTKFGTVNMNRDVGDYIVRMKKMGRIHNKTQEKLLRRQLDLNKKLFEKFIHLPRKLSEKFPELKIIVRPHPSEKHDIWIEKSKTFRNVKVVYEGNVNDWMSHAKVVIQNNCTTAVESFLLGTPVISYRPYIDELVENKLVQAISIQTYTEQELMSSVESVIEDGSMANRLSEEAKMLLHYYICNVDGPLASSKVMEALDMLDIDSNGANFPVSLPRKQRILETISKVKSGLNLNADNRYGLQKMPGINVAEVNKIVAELCDALSIDSKIEVVKAYKDCFSIFKDS